MEEARRLARHSPPACDQVLYHLGERAAEHAVIPWCERQRTAFVAYSPFGHGDFPESHRVLQQIASEVNATPRQVALRFILRFPNTFVIPKASTLRHVEENAGAGDLHLTADQIARLENAFPLGRVPRSLPML
jgi:diketogulonate reductase-like aldo/keto reductase